MGYGSLIRRAWERTWRHPFLWVLGLFAPSTVGSCSPGTGGTGTQWRASPEDVERISPGLEPGLREAGRWLIQNQEFVATLVAVLVAGAVILGLLFLVASLIAQGGMARATADLSMGRPSSLRQAWEVGLRLVWRYLLLWLLLILVAVLVSLTVAAFFGLIAVLFSVVTDTPRVILLGVAAVLGVVLLVVAIPVLIAASVVVAFGQRAIAVEDVGPVAALETGARLVWRNLGTTAIAWLINLALSIGAGIAIVLAFLVAAIPPGVVAFVLFSVTGVSEAAIIFAVVAALALVGVLWFLAAVANTFFWHYWTMVYLNLSGRLNARMEPL